jgi:hypothetical protein
MKYDWIFELNIGEAKNKFLFFGRILSKNLKDGAFDRSNKEAEQEFFLSNFITLQVCQKKENNVTFFHRCHF